MNAYLYGDKLNVSVSNLPEFYQLIKKAAQQAEQLLGTIRELERYELGVLFSTSETTCDE